MKHKRIIVLFLVCAILFLSFPIRINASSKYVVLNTGVYIRKGPGTNYGFYVLGSSGSRYNLKSENIVADEPKNGGCDSGWYQIEYGTSTGYVCASYVSVKDPTDPLLDRYGRPWTSPKLAIVGGAIWISDGYISKGQNTAYLKKFNVNPKSAYNIYGHQYMANLAAPYSEAYTSFKSYRDNNLLSLPLEFSIPIYDNMPDYTTLPGRATDKTGQADVKDEEFEKLLDAEKFPESYKCKLRLLHNVYPNWTFKAIHTGLDFNKSVKAEKNVSSIQGGDIYYDFSTGKKIQSEPGWYIANDSTVGYYLDPRNFLNAERILMFENLGYSESYTEKVVSSILAGTFMSGISVLDNQSYASIFVEAGKKGNISAVYLASLARQESGTVAGTTTSGGQFAYKDVTYKGVYNFFNIGAFSSEANPALAGLVWASGGSPDVIVSNPNDSNSGGSTNTDKNTEEDMLKKINASVKQNCLTNIEMGTTISTLKSKLSGYTVSVSNAKDTDKIKTGQEITITKDKESYKYTIVVKGDVDGDGALGASDYVKIKNYIMEKSGSNLNVAQSLAADVDGSGSIGASDYVQIKNSIMRS